MLIRPVSYDDYDAIFSITKKTGKGFTSLQPHPEQIEKKLLSVSASFSDTPTEEALYFFVLENPDNRQIVGTCAIKAAVGLTSPWYSYQVNQHVNASASLNIYHSYKTLHLCNNHTGCSELCSIFLEQDYRRGGLSKLLSRSRLLFMAMHKERFSDQVIAEIRGYFDENDNSPFWHGLGERFFKLDYFKADSLSSYDKSFISELIPKHPIIIDFLPESAQAVISKEHNNAAGARKILENEGLRYTRYVDIFDAGPLLEAHIDQIKTISEARPYSIKIITQHKIDRLTNRYLVANNKLKDFRCMQIESQLNDDENLELTHQEAELLQLDNGDTVFIVNSN